MWRQKQGKEPLPVPAPPKVEAVPEAKLRLVLQAVRDAKTVEERRSALATLEAMGLPALPGIRDLLKEMTPTDPAQGEVRSLAGQIALIAREARFGDGSAKPSTDLRQAVESLQESRSLGRRW